MAEAHLKSISLTAPTETHPQPEARIVLLTDDIDVATNWARLLGDKVIVQIQLPKLPLDEALEVSIQTNGTTPKVTTSRTGRQPASA